MDTNSRNEKIPTGDLLIKISRLINRLFHNKSYMLCSFLWIISHKKRVRNSILITYIAFIIYIPSRHVIDIFFRIKRGQKNHCMECFYYESQQEGIIPVEDIEGMQCTVWRNYLKIGEKK